MTREVDLISLRYRLHYRCYQAQGRRLHVLIWVTGVLILAAIAGPTISFLYYLNSDLANPKTVPLALVGIGLTMAVIVTGISRIVAVVPKIVAAHNDSPAMPLVQELETCQGRLGCLAP